MPFDSSNHQPIPEGHRRLLVLADFLETKVPREHFDMGTWWCKSAGCAIGWGCTIPEFQAAGLRIDRRFATPTFAGNFGHDAAAAFFGIAPGSAFDLFNAAFQTGNLNRGPHEVAGRIRAFVAEANATTASQPDEIGAVARAASA